MTVHQGQRTPCVYLSNSVWFSIKAECTLVYSYFNPSKITKYFLRTAENKVFKNYERVHYLIRIRHHTSLIKHESKGNTVVNQTCNSTNIICVCFYTWTNLSGLDFIGQTRGPPPSPLQASWPTSPPAHTKLWSNRKFLKKYF